MTHSLDIGLDHLVSSGTMSIIGIDCAADPRKTGIALGRVGPNGNPSVSQVASGLRKADLLATLLAWTQSVDRCLFALDAPLGWPDALRDGLPSHRAGAVLDGPADHLFMRATDHYIWRTVGKRPLEVGADRIARAAKAATGLLADLRDRLGHPIPLAWETPPPSAYSAIEVYPAATLAAYRIAPTPYKKRVQVEARRNLRGSIQPELLTLHVDVSLLDNSADALDACICVLAGADFLRGSCCQPSDRSVAVREGWIWTRSPSTTGKT
jgi:hypothetical protein